MSFRESMGRVVIGECDGIETFVVSEGDQLRRRAVTITGGGVRVEIGTAGIGQSGRGLAKSREGLSARHQAGAFAIVSRMPFTNVGESSEPKRRDNSMASLIAAAAGVGSGAKRNS